MKSYDWHNVRERLREALRFVPTFLAHPARGMRTLPDWDWPTILILQAAFAALTACFAALVGRHWVLVVTSLVVAPITYFVINTVISGFFHYVFKFGFSRDVPFRQVYLASTFASIPVQILVAISPFFPPIMILGAAAYAWLLFQTTVDTFRVPVTRARALLIAWVVIYAGINLRSYIATKHHRVQIKERASPESMDILERELNLNDD